MNQELFYRNITTVVRTPRFAVLVDKNETYWKAYISGIVQSFSQVWGGEHFIIVPTDGKMIDDDFWKILEAYSPDYIGRYLPNIFDLEEVNPKRYAQIKEQQRISWNISDEEFEEQWTKQASDMRLKGLDVDKSLSEQLKNRLSPFHFQDHIVSENVFRNSQLGYPFTHIASIVEQAKDRPYDVTQPMKLEDAAYNLLSLSRAGALSNEYKQSLEDKGFTISNLPTNLKMFRLRDYVVALESNEYDPRPMKAFGGDKNQYPPDNFVRQLPYKLSMLHLGKFYRHNVHRDWEENKLVIIGDTMDDYCLYYCLSRLHDGVYWLPNRHLHSAHRRIVTNKDLPDEEAIPFNDNESAASGLVNEYYKSIGYGHDKKRILVTSKTLSLLQLSYRRQWMSEICFSGSELLSRTDVIPSSDISVNCVMQVIESNNYANQQDMVFQNGHSVGRLNTPKPKHFDVINPAEHRWITGVNIEGFCPPALPFLGHQLIEYRTTENETRSAGDGLAYFSPNAMHFGEDIDVNLVRPKIHLMSDTDMFKRYFEYSGYSVELSDKGSYLKDTMNRFGSLEAVATFFRAESRRKLFDQFLIGKGGQDKVVIYLDAENRAYISFGAFQRTLGSVDEAIAVVDDLISKDIISRGFIFQCSRCRLSAWYSVANISNEFTCTRCGLSQTYSHKSWKQPEEPRWYYHLTETVYQFYKSNSHITALALDKLHQEAPGEFHFVSETEIVDENKKKQEIDILAIVKGNIILGECKNTPVVVGDIKKYLRIFAKLNIKPFQLLLATTEHGVSSSVQTELDKFSSHRIMTRQDLYE